MFYINHIYIFKNKKKSNGINRSIYKPFLNFLSTCIKLIIKKQTLFFFACKTHHMKDIQWNILNQANKWFHFGDQHHKTSPRSDRSPSFQSSSEFWNWIVSPEWWLLKKAGTEVECIRLCCWTLCKDHHLKIITFIIILNYHQKYCM